MKPFGPPTLPLLDPMYPLHKPKVRPLSLKLIYIWYIYKLNFSFSEKAPKICVIAHNFVAFSEKLNFTLSFQFLQLVSNFIIFFYSILFLFLRNPNCLTYFKIVLYMINCGDTKVGLISDSFSLCDKIS